MNVIMLEIDFDKAYAQVGKMEQCADGMLEQHNKLVSLIAEVRGAWQGESANAYIKKMEALAEKIKSDAEKCRANAKSFRLKIGTIKKAEESIVDAMGKMAGN